jgi:hypothetical protein
MTESAGVEVRIRDLGDSSTATVEEIEGRGEGDDERPTTG